MSQKDKLIQRFLSKPKDFTYQELKRLLGYFGYVEDTVGKTSGSRISFVNHDSNHRFNIHQPHSPKELRTYQIEEIIERLNEEGLL